MTGAIAALFSGVGTVAVVLSPTAVSGWADPGATANISTGSVIATPSGGAAPYTYAWSQVGVSPYTWTISAATSATTSFTGVSIPQGVNTNATFKLIVTDNAGNHSAPVQIIATVRNKVTDFGFDSGGKSGGSA